jgi:putative DNA primase/helicase
VLASYRDWKDSSEWPVSERVHNLVQRAIKKQGDPLEKPGIVGAFCRTYNIHEVIETYLGDVYEDCDIDGRYTFKEGSTSGGLITYDDKFAYSHHGTDPVSGKLCNAFDLVRLHLFGLKDEDAREDTPINKMPSYLAMEEHATKDAKVRKQLGSERLHSAKEDFQNIHDSEEEDYTVEVDDEWMKDLDVDKKGNYISSIDNIYKILKFDPNLRGRLCFDEFENRLIAIKNLPWRKVTKQTRDFSDDDSDCLAHYLECYQMPFTHIAKALSKIRNEFKSHPIRSYMESLHWDGVQRLESLFIEYLGAEDSPYTRAATRKTFIAAVARVFQPGIKFDTVLTLIGKEGIGKSTIIRKMAKEWFSDCLGDVHTKDGMESLRGVWIMEIAELASFRSKDQDAIKRFITSCEDLYRPAYGKQQVRFPRQCVFFATTNKYDFLSGPHDHRRFLPIDTHVNQPSKNVFQHFTDEEINQAWAEALHYYRTGESLDLSDEVKILASRTREKHNEVDDRAGVIEQYLNTLLPENWSEMKFGDRRDYIQGGGFITAENSGTEMRTEVCVAEIWCELLSGFQKDMTTHNTKYIHDILKKMKGWQPMKKLKNFRLYGRQRGYERVKNSLNTNVNTRDFSLVNGGKNVNTRTQK